MIYTLNNGKWGLGKGDEFQTSFKFMVCGKRICLKATVKAYKEEIYPKFLPKFIGKFFKSSKVYSTITFNQPFIVDGGSLTSERKYVYKKNLLITWELFEERELPELIKIYRKFVKENRNAN